MSVEKITARILQEAQDEAAALKAKAEAERAAMLQKAKDEAAMQTLTMQQKAQTDALLLKERRKSVAELEARKLRLSAKQEMIETAFDEAAEQLVHMDQEEYNRRYDAYSERFEAARKRLAEIAELRQERNAKKTRIRLFMENMNNHQELVQSFDEELWYSTVDYVTVYEDKRLVFTFRDGRQIEITAELWRAA